MYLPAAVYCLARGLIESDEYDEAEEILVRVEYGSPPTGTFAAWRHEARGRLAGATGDWEQALAEFLACGECAEAAARTSTSPIRLLSWAARSGEPDAPSRPATPFEKRSPSPTTSVRAARRASAARSSDAPAAAPPVTATAPLN